MTRAAPPPTTSDSSGSAAGTKSRESSSRRRRVADKVATHIVTVGGVAIIASVLGILAFIIIEVLPFLSQPEVRPVDEQLLTGPSFTAIVVNEHRTLALGLHDRGLRAVNLADGSDAALDGPDLRPYLPFVQACAVPTSQTLAGATGDGRVVCIPYEFELHFDEDRRVVTPRVQGPEAFELDPGNAVRTFAVQRNDVSTTVAAQLADNRVVVIRSIEATDFLSGEVSRAQEREAQICEQEILHLVLDRDQRNLFGGTRRGKLIWWRLEEGELGDPQIVSAGSSAVSALTLLLGDLALAVGQEDGSLSVWFPARTEGERLRLVQTRTFPAHDSAVRHFAVSQRDRRFLALDEAGELGLYHSTTEQMLWRGPVPATDVQAVIYCPKADAAVLATPSSLVQVDVEVKHCEVTSKILFGKVWYESYEKPEYVWQSTGGTEENEPKLSLIPLLFGTIKGTLFALLIAIPLGVLGAVYTSQFMSQQLRSLVKPVVEIMASLPSVVLGFLAGLWLAPRMEAAFPGLILTAIAIPVSVVSAGALWNRLPRRVRGRLPQGLEVSWFMLTLSVVLVVCFLSSRSVEIGVFGGDFRDWLQNTLGLHYDQRNAIVIGIAMGFAVIPIIFAISEDALSNVPRSLISASLALGADRWQTVQNVVLPAASPGIFSAIMIGFGRAVGETMIVLMATGNTPIMDWNPFNGLRTLSANIAVEIPEAPQGGTLYRTLFLSALLLFAFTFVLNTAADIIRQRLRRRYSSV